MGRRSKKQELIQDVDAQITIALAKEMTEETRMLLSTLRSLRHTLSQEEEKRIERRTPYRSGEEDSDEGDDTVRPPYALPFTSPFKNYIIRALICGALVPETVDMFDFRCRLSKKGEPLSEEGKANFKKCESVGCKAKGDTDVKRHGQYDEAGSKTTVQDSQASGRVS